MNGATPGAQEAVRRAASPVNSADASPTCPRPCRRPRTLSPHCLRPDRAAFEINTSTDSLIPVMVATDAHEHLSRACADGLRVGRSASIPVWLAAPDPAGGHLVLHLGDRRIGTVSAADTTVFATAFR